MELAEARGSPEGEKIAFSWCYVPGTNSPHLARAFSQHSCFPIVGTAVGAKLQERCIPQPLAQLQRFSKLCGRPRNQNGGSVWGEGVCQDPETSTAENDMR